jgi:hypothetical protein
MRVGPTIISPGPKVTVRRHLREQRFAKRDWQVQRKQSERSNAPYWPPLSGREATVGQRVRIIGDYRLS